MFYKAGVIRAGFQGTRIQGFGGGWPSAFKQPKQLRSIRVGQKDFEKMNYQCEKIQIEA